MELFTVPTAFSIPATASPPLLYLLTAVLLLARSLDSNVLLSTEPTCVYVPAMAAGLDVVAISDPTIALLNTEDPSLWTPEFSTYEKTD